MKYLFLFIALFILTSCHPFSEKETNERYGFFRNKFQYYSWHAAFAEFRSEEICCNDSADNLLYDSLVIEYKVNQAKADECLDSIIKYAKHLP